MRPEPPAGELTDDAVLGGRLRLLQPRRGHRFGHDAILLAAAAPARPGELAIDLGAGVGAAGLALAARVPGLAVTLIERDQALAELAVQNAERNDLADRVRSVALDLGASPQAFADLGVEAGTADRIIANPPFNDPARMQASPDRARRLAHVGAGDVLSIWVACAARLLRKGGTLTLIYRADGVQQVLAALAGSFGGLAILPIHPKPDAPAIRIIVQAEKGCHAPPVHVSPLVLNDAAGHPTAEAERILRDLAALPLDSETLPNR